MLIKLNSQIFSFLTRSPSQVYRQICTLVVQQWFHESHGFLLLLFKTRHFSVHFTENLVEKKKDYRGGVAAWRRGYCLNYNLWRTGAIKSRSPRTVLLIFAPRVYANLQLWRTPAMLLAYLRRLVYTECTLAWAGVYR